MWRGLCEISQTLMARNQDQVKNLLEGSEFAVKCIPRCIWTAITKFSAMRLPGWTSAAKDWWKRLDEFFREAKFYFMEEVKRWLVNLHFLILKLAKPNSSNLILLARSGKATGKVYL